MDKKERKEIQDKQLEIINEIENISTLEHVVKDNMVEFKSGEKTYRVRKPDFTERQELSKAKRKKYLEYLKDETMLFRKEWIDLYKKKGIDIGKMDSDMTSINAEMEAVLLKLAKVEDIKVIGNIKKDLDRLRRKMWDINVEKTDLLENSIEDQLMMFVNGYTGYLVLEEKEIDKWVKHFKCYEDYQKCNDTHLLVKTFDFLNKLIYGEYDVQ